MKTIECFSARTTDIGASIELAEDKHPNGDFVMLIRTRQHDGQLLEGVRMDKKHVFELTMGLMDFLARSGL